MSSLNRWTGIGNVGRDCEPVRYTQSGQAVTSFSVACTEKYGGRDGSPQSERTEWVTCVVWGRQAEIAAQYIRKGRQVYIEGRLQTRDWVDPQGVKHYKCEVICQRFLLLGNRESSGVNGNITGGARQGGDAGSSPALSNYDGYDIGDMPPLDMEAQP